MNVLLGREAQTSGSISYCSPEYAGRLPSNLLDRVVAVVPQNDVCLREMTVYELVEHSALWRSPIKSARELVLRRVEQVLSELQLQHLRDVAVGGLGQAGSALSPGDRKKVNIALELVADPNVLFLDEPTTGIDASSALSVARIIANLAHCGLTCVAVIHQPRAEIFSLMDDMIILVRGGRVAYQGPTKHVLEYFASLGCTLTDQRANKTDFLIDLTSKPPPEQSDIQSSAHGATLVNAAAVLDPRKVGDSSSAKATVQTWADFWERDGKVGRL
jgi:ABC-type multidrug transport system ATPase subunit